MAQTRPSPTLSRGFTRFGRFLAPYGQRTGRCRVIGFETPADVYPGRRPAILVRRERIKQRTLQQRRQENLMTPHPAAERREVSLATQPQWSGLV